jgi:L-alanine-DL-glutamate epimerase-like enolase superfamily enzyme
LAKATDAHPAECRLYFLPIRMRVPIKFGAETTTSTTCARVWMRVEDRAGRSAEGWGETPLSATWVWPASLSQAERLAAMQEFCLELAPAWRDFPASGHPLEVGQDFQSRALPGLLERYNRDERPGLEPMPWLAALVCCSAFDLALHDAYGNLLGLPVYSTYTPQYLGRDLSAFLEPAEGSGVSFAGRYPVEFLQAPPAQRLAAWHLVGGVDPLEPEDLKGDEPRDGYPVLLRDWIRRDGLQYLKVKLRGTDAEWDHRRLVRVGTIGREEGSRWLSADFNCTVREPAYVEQVLDLLEKESPEILRMILYVEQPFPYELERHPIPVHGISARKPLFLDESAHDWKMVRLGRSLGWSGVALKTCKTQSGAILSLCWAKAHGMSLMVQDLTNPMLALIPHALLAAHAGTLRGVEVNACQFYPDASRPEEAVHPGLYRRRAGEIDLASIQGPGFGYRAGEIRRNLPPPAA